MALLTSRKFTTSADITNLYADKIVFCVYGSGQNGSIPTGITYTLQTAIDSDGFLMDDAIYKNYSSPSQDSILNVGRFAIKITGTMQANDYIVVEYKQY